MLNALFSTEGFHSLFSLSAIDCFEGARFVVNAGMQDTGIVPGLVFCQAFILLKHGNSELRTFAAETVGGRQAHDSATNYAHVVLQATSSRS